MLIADPQVVYSEGDIDSIRHWLKRLSNSEVARESGVSQRMLGNIRQGTRQPSADKAAVIVEAMSRMLDTRALLLKR